MTKYKAKKSYSELKEAENYDGLGSPSKHGLLVAGYEIELNIVPENILPHLTEVKEKTTTKEK